jgi:putative ABC transport system permease protein
MTIGDRTEMVRGMRVSGGYLDLLGATLQMGRSFADGDDASALILTDAAWRELFGGDPRVIGRAVQGSGGGGYRIIGVLSPDFHPLHMTNPGEFPRLFLFEYDLRRNPCRACPDVRVVARLARGVGVREAQAEMNAITVALSHEDPVAYGGDVTRRVAPLRDQLLGDFGVALSMAQAVAALFLLLACASVATLLLAQGTRRRPEFALRAALGAGRRRIVRQLLVECLLLAGTGGLFGVAIAWSSMWIIVRTAATEIPRLQEMAPDASMLWFGVVISTVTGLLFGLAPALRAARVDLNTAMKAIDGTTGNGMSDRTAMNALITVEVMLAFVLVLAAGVLGKSYVRLLNIDAGFDAHRVLTLSLMPDGLHYGSAERRLGYYDAVVERARRIPDVDAAGYASTLPLSHPEARRLFVLERAVALDADAPIVDRYLASPDYFRALKIAVRRGRAFAVDDRRGGAPVAIVSESAANTIFRGEDPIGRHIQVGVRDARQPWATIVGIVGDVHQYGLDVSAGPAAYLPFAQAPNVQGWASLVVHARTEPARIDAAVRAALVEVDPTQPQFHVQSMDAYVSKSVAQRTFTFALVAVCGAAALLIATLGIYGVVSYLVGMRTREAAIRVALGAPPADFMRRTTAQVGALAAGAVGVGLIIAGLGANTLSPLLFGVSALDPQTVGVVSAIVIASALAAAYLPARRMARVDPMTALRSG